MAEESADRLVARAIESVLDQVPGIIDTSVPEGGTAKLQPWAETAAPVSRNKRPLEELLAELEERVAAQPDAKATLPRSRHPAQAFFDRFGRTGRGQPNAGEGAAAPAGEGSGRRRRRRRGGGASAPALPTAGAADTGRQSPGRRRSRRGRGAAVPVADGSRQGAPPGQGRPRPPASGPPAAEGGQPRAPGSGSGRRRRGRRGRGGAQPPSA